MKKGEIRQACRLLEASAQKARSVCLRRLLHSLSDQTAATPGSSNQIEQVGGRCVLIKRENELNDTDAGNLEANQKEKVALIDYNKCSHNGLQI